MRNLAGGRMPPLTRTALLAGLAAFLLALIVFKPGSPSLPKATPASSTAMLLSSDDPLAQRTLLLDESLAFLPPSPSLSSVGSDYQVRPEDSPFPFIPPRLRFEPGRTADLPLESDFSRISDPLDAVNIKNGDITSTFGSTKAPLSTIKSRSFRCVVSPIDSLSKPVITLEVGEIPNFNLKSNQFGMLKAIIGVDSLGLLGRPTLIQTSGDAGSDRAIMEWLAARQWVGQVGPGVYQVLVGP